MENTADSEGLERESFEAWFAEFGMPLSAGFGYNLREVSWRAWNAGVHAEREACACLLEENAQRFGEESMLRLILETNVAEIRARSNAKVSGLAPGKD